MYVEFSVSYSILLLVRLKLFILPGRLLGQVEIPLGEVREKKKVEKRAYDLEDGKHNAIMVNSVL